MSNSNSNNEDGWQTTTSKNPASKTSDDFIQQPPKRTSKQKRIYVGNLRLPSSSSSSSPKEVLSSKLRSHFEQSCIKIPPNGIEVVPINSTNSSSAYALIECNDVNEAIKRCDQSRFDGRTIRVSRERKNIGTRGGAGGGGGGGGKGKKGFGSAGWSKPRASKSKPSVHNKKPPAKVVSAAEITAPDSPQCSHNNNETKQQSKTATTTENTALNDATDDLITTSETVKSIISNEISEPIPPGDELNAVLASAAALGVMSCVVNNSNDGENGEDKKDDDDEQVDQDEKISQKQPNSLLLGNAASLSTLLADYGEQDLNFKVESTKESSPPTPSTTSPQQQQRRGILAPQNKAPIQITITSFGYKYGVPSSYKQNGWSYSNPLAPHDCRDVKEVPKYLHKCSGLSYRVKRLMLRNDYGEERENNEEDYQRFENDNDDDEEDVNNDKNDTKVEKNPIRQTANEIASSIHTIILEAIHEGVASYASPLSTSIYIGSTHGKHRSVVLTEITAQSLRTLLRNTSLEEEVLVSVGTLHRDVDREYSLEDYIEGREGGGGPVDEGMEMYYGMDGMKEKRKGGVGKRRSDRRRR